MLFEKGLGLFGFWVSGLGFVRLQLIAAGADLAAQCFHEGGAPTFKAPMLFGRRRMSCDL